MRPDPFASNATALLLAGAVAALLCSGCDRQEVATPENDDQFFKEPAKVIEETRTVRLAGEPTAFLRAQADSPIHWQPWSPELLAHAEAEQRPIFLLVASGRFQPVAPLLRNLGKNPSLVTELHDHYVCSLADIEAHPELALLATHLSGEIRRPISFPFMAWFSYEGNPVAWLPLASRDVEDFSAVWESSHAMVSKIWRESPRYVIFNSRRDNANRSERVASGVRDPVDRRAAYEAVFKAAARIGSFYDPASRSIDGSGGLVPTTQLQFSAAVALDPASPPDLRDRLTRLVDGAGDSILRGAIRDPLDGGLFHARRASGWALPVPVKDSPTQNSAAIAYARAHALLGTPETLTGAREFMEFNAATFGEGGNGIGLYSTPTGKSPDAFGFLWSQERLKELLSADEFAVATTAFGTSGLGNIPPESDPRRLYFRKNSLGMKQTVAETAASLGRPEAEVRDLLDSGRKRLLAERLELLQRADDIFLETTRITAVNAQYAISLATLAQVTGEEEFVTRSRAIIAFLRERHYSQDGGLMRIVATERHRGVAARGQDYALLLSALFHLYRLDLDPSHMQWAEALASEALEMLGDEESILLETPPADRFGIFPISNPAMIFGPSTWGTIFGPLGRLQLLAPDRAREDVLSALRSHLTPALAEVPLIHSDFAMSVLVEARGCIIFLEGSREAPAFQELHRACLAPEFDSATLVHLSPELPESFQLPAAGTGPRARVLRKGEEAGEAQTAADLQRLLREVLGSR